jgi:hypothetical protein
MIVRRRPVNFDARQLLATTRKQLLNWLGDKAWTYDSNADHEMYVETPKGGAMATGGDWIIKAEDGTLSVHSNANFKLLFETA